jgi:hypothetical protein
MIARVSSKSPGFARGRPVAVCITGVPTDAYAVGSAFFKGAGQFDFTADIVATDRGDGWRECSQGGPSGTPQPPADAGRVARSRQFS